MGRSRPVNGGGDLMRPTDRDWVDVDHTEWREGDVKEGRCKSNCNGFRLEEEGRSIVCFSSGRVGGKSLSFLMQRRIQLGLLPSFLHCPAEGKGSPLPSLLLHLSPTIVS